MNYFQCIGNGGGSGGGSVLISKTITDNGTYIAANDNADGYSRVVVDVAKGGLYTTETVVISSTYTTT